MVWGVRYRSLWVVALGPVCCGLVERRGFGVGVCAHAGSAESSLGLLLVGAKPFGLRLVSAKLLLRGSDHRDQTQDGLC